jgi:SWI/SNF-related matrix-associated actin-dependent regulator 1 of chromatin subfamily A
VVTSPYIYQIKAAREIYQKQGKALVAYEMGLGKCLISLLMLHRHPDWFPAVVVSPSGLKYTWERESATHFGFRAEVLNGTFPPPEGSISAPARLQVVSYNLLGKIRSKYTGPGWLNYLKKYKPQLVILDEVGSHLTNRNSKATRAVRELCREVPHVLALSGTPLLNRPAELWPILNILRPDLFPSFGAFAFRYCAAHQNLFGHWDYSGSSNLEELHALLRDTVMLRKLKSEVLSELPPRTSSVVPVELQDFKQYHKAEQDFIAWLMEQGPSLAVKAGVATALTRTGYLRRLSGELKLPAVIQWVDGFLRESDRKLVIFAVHKKVIAALKKHLGGTCVVVDGSTQLKTRQAHVEAFQGHKGPRVFIGNIQAAGTGLTLTASSTVLFAEIDWVPANMIQAACRVDRIGQVYPVNIYYAVAQRTLEENIVRLLHRKQKVISAVLDGGSQTDDLSTFAELLGELYQLAPKNNSSFQSQLPFPPRS